MCLDTVTRTERIDTPIRVWKIVNSRTVMTLFKRRTSFGLVVPIPKRNRWTRAKIKILSTDEEPIAHYLSGFHCFITLEDAIKFLRVMYGYNWRETSRTEIIEVMIRGDLTYGKDRTARVVVAEEMMVL